MVRVTIGRMSRIDPDERRKQLVEAAYRVIVERGISATRLSDVAERAGVASSLISYYFPNRDDLLMEATRFGIDRFTEERAAVLARITDPLERLEAAITSAIPDDSRDADWVILMEFWTSAIRRSSMQTLAATMWTRARVLYTTIIEEGTVAGRFRPTAPADEIAASIVGMLDGLAPRVIVRDPAIDPELLDRLVIEYARLAVGVPPREGAA